jgi:predicted RNA-binding protein YlxR (DUF448 family)
MRRSLPQRTCIACRSTAVKRELVRVVRTPQGRVELDLTGKRAGRGAYVCRRPECWEAALKRDRLASALKTKMAAEDRQALVAFAASLKEETAV